MPTVNLQVNASTDDARNVAGDASKQTNPITQHLGKFSTTDYYNGFRFTNVTVPQGATIQSALIDFYYAEAKSGTTASVIFYGQDVDDATTFNVTTDHPEGKTPATTATVAHNYTLSNFSTLGFGNETVDIASIIQEIVNRAGWVSGNDIVIVGHDNGSSDDNYFGFSTYDRATDRGATLAVTYTTISLDAPSDVTAVEGGDGNIDVSWTDNSADEDGFRIERKEGGSSNWYQVAEVAADVETWEDTDVFPGYSYTYRVKAYVDEGDESSTASSSEVTMTGSKGWRSLIQAWIYPGNPATNADEEYSDGRTIHFLKPEYFTINVSGELELLTEAGSGENAYTEANAAEVVSYSNYQFVTVSSDNVNMATLFGSAPNMATAISTLVDFCVDNNFTGVELDWEGFGNWTAQNYSDYLSFVTDLGNALHAEGKLLMLDGPPITNETEQGYYEWQYEDFESLPVDYLCMMLYDYQYDYGAGESVQPAVWAQNGCEWIRGKITDIDRIVIGLPSYGYYGVTAGYSITIQTKTQISAQTGYGTATRNSDDEMTWTNGGNSYVYQDTTGMNAKRERLEDEGIRNIAVWHLGGNDWFSAYSEQQISQGGGGGSNKLSKSLACINMQSLIGF